MITLLQLVLYLVLVGILYWTCSIAYAMIYVPYFCKFLPLRRQLPAGSATPFRILVGTVPAMIAAQTAGLGAYYMVGMKEKYGMVYVKHFLLNVVELTISDPRYIASILRTKALSFSKGQTLREFMRPLSGVRNLLLEEGAVHALHRRMSSPSFQHESLKEILMIMNIEIHLFVDALVKQVESETEPVSINLLEQMAGLTMNVLASTSFGSSFRNYPLGNATAICKQAFSESVEHLQWRFRHGVSLIPFIKDLPMFYKPEIDGNLQQVKEMVRFFIRERREGNSRSLNRTGEADLLELLLNAQDETTGTKFTDEEVVDQALVFLIAGHETSATALTWCIFYLLHHRRDLWDAIAAEVDQVCGSAAACHPTHEQLSSSIVLDAVIKEIMRLYSPVTALFRETEEDVVISGTEVKDLHVPKGILLTIEVANIHRLEQYWGKNAHEFDHTRWFNKQERAQQHPYAYMPFGHGNRSCIGNNFALMEIKSILAVIISTFNSHSKYRLSTRSDQPLIRGMPPSTLQLTWQPRDAVMLQLAAKS